MDSIERLAGLFEKFPGIGPRQAQRFVQFILRSNGSLRHELIDSLQQLGNSVRQCDRCMRFHAGKEKTCSTCANPLRDASLLAIVATDPDVLALERSGTFKGLYFVLGGTISLASEKTNGLRIQQLLDSIPIRTKSGLSEIILAFPANPEGDATAIRVNEELTQITGNNSIRITSLGRGLSTGSELEYADPATIQSAFANRR